MCPRVYDLGYWNKENYCNRKEVSFCMYHLKRELVNLIHYHYEIVSREETL